jgi:hypothetical protein
MDLRSRLLVIESSDIQNHSKIVFICNEKLSRNKAHWSSAALFHRTQNLNKAHKDYIKQQKKLVHWSSLGCMMSFHRQNLNKRKNDSLNILPLSALHNCMHVHVIKLENTQKILHKTPFPWRYVRMDKPRFSSCKDQCHNTNPFLSSMPSRSSSKGKVCRTYNSC